MTSKTPRENEIRQRLNTLAAVADTPEGRAHIDDGLDDAVRRGKFSGGIPGKIRLMYAYFRDPAESLKAKLLIGAALLYLVIPTDLIPDWFAMLGFTDDLVAIALVWRALRDILTHYETRRQQRLLKTG